MFILLRKKDLKGIKKEVRYTINMYQFPIMNITIMYYKYVLIKKRKRKRKCRQIVKLQTVSQGGRDTVLSKQAVSSATRALTVDTQ